MAPVSEDFLTNASPAWDPARVVGKFPRLPGTHRLEGGRRRRGVFRRRDPDWPLVTVLTPCLNAADSLAETLRSVRAQSHPNIEHIVIDGGSTDGTRDLLGAFDDVLDYYVSAPDNGLYDALNKGLALAAGDFVMMLSADDVYTPQAIETLLRNHAASGADVVGGLAVLKGANDAMSYVHTRDGYTARCLIAMCLRFESLLVPAWVYNQLGGFDARYRIAGDTAFAARLYAAGLRLYEVAQPLLEMWPGGLSANPAKVSAEHRRMLTARFPAVDPATRALAAERTRFSRRAYDRAIAATQDHPAFVEALIADGYGRPGGYSRREPAPAMVKSARRLSVILPKSGNEKAAVDFLSTLTSSVEVLRPATANAKALTSALAKARGDYVYFADPDAPPEKGALSRLIDAGDRDYAEIVRGATVAGDDGPPGGARLRNSQAQLSPRLLARSDWLSRAVIRRRCAQNGVFDPALGPYAPRLYALTLALSAIRVCWLPEGVAAAPAADAVLDQVPGDAADWAAALTWHGRAWVLLSDAGYTDAAAAEAAAVETLGRRLADAETLSPEERQRLSRQMATLRRQIAHPLVDPGWDPARAGIPPGTAGRNTP